MGRRPLFYTIPQRLLQHFPGLVGLAGLQVFQRVFNQARRGWGQVTDVSPSKISTTVRAACPSSITSAAQ